jgi:hypothetical protein
MILRSSDGTAPATTVLESGKAATETRYCQRTTSTGIMVAGNTTERRFGCEGRREGDSVLAFLVYKDGVPQPAIEFSTRYSSRNRESCDSVYMVPPAGPQCTPSRLYATGGH